MVESNKKKVFSFKNIVKTIILTSIWIFIDKQIIPITYRGPLLVLLLVIFPIIIITHELGHAFFVKVFGGEIKKIVIGEGKKMFSLGVFEFRLFIFLRGVCYWKKDSNLGKLKRIIILSGGVFLNFIFSLILYILVQTGILAGNSFLDSIIKLSFIIGVGNLVPITIDGRNTDGKQIFQVLWTGTSSLIESKSLSK